MAAYNSVNSMLSILLTEITNVGYSSEDFETVVLDAIANSIEDYGFRNSRRKKSEISVVSGTDSYDLPSDFVKMIDIESIFSDGVGRSQSGKLVVVGADIEDEVYSIEGNKIVFFPVPTYSMTRTLWYGAGHVADSDDVYTSMSRNDVRIAMLKMRSLIYGSLRQKNSGSGVDYTIGHVRVSSASKKLGQFKDMEEKFKNEYERALAEVIGHVGVSF